MLPSVNMDGDVKGTIQIGIVILCSIFPKLRKTHKRTEKSVEEVFVSVLQDHLIYYEKSEPFLGDLGYPKPSCSTGNTPRKVEICTKYSSYSLVRDLCIERDIEDMTSDVYWKNNQMKILYNKIWLMY